MKKIVVFDEYNEIDLKPSDLLQEYVHLTEKDIVIFFLEKNNLKEINCPGCHDKNIRSSFIRFGLRYAECSTCCTLYITPRPEDAALRNYFDSSEARLFWHNELSKKTRQRRQEKIIRPRFTWILDSTQEYLPEAEHIVDINTEQYGYIGELIENLFFKRKTLLNPCIHLDSSKLNGRINLLNTPLGTAALKDYADVVSIFEVADRVSDIDALFDGLYGMLNQNGLCFMTGILISGFDVQTLWDKAENIFPPDRLNVFSVEGLNALFKRHNFECLEFSTPGILDVEHVETVMQSDPHIKLPKFIEYMLRNRSEESKRLFQEFLQENLLSSYARIVLRKK